MHKTLSENVSAFPASVWQDLRYAVRSLLSKRLFTITALSVLALGIGINTATFSVLNGFALRPLPVNDPGLLISNVQQEIAKVDGGAFPRAYTLDSNLDQQMLPGRVLSAIGAVLGVFGLLLASLGLGGIVAYSVASRTREIGIRISMGATSGNIIRLILNRISILVLVGVAAGVISSAMLSKFLVSLLFGVSPFDPLAFGVASGFLITVAVLAAFIPARRAARIDPIVALRQE